MKILIIEDEEALAKVLKENFENLDFQVKIAKDGEAGFREAKKLLPDIILLDLLLPKRHGLEVLKDLKADAESQAIPVIVLSNLEGDESIKKALAYGAEDYFAKTQHPIMEVVEKVRARLLSPGIK